MVTPSDQDAAAVTRPLLAALDHEHREIDRVIEGYVAARGAAPRSRDALQQAIVLLRRHIHVEEDLLFPALNDAGLKAPVFVMLREHGTMWPVLDALDAALVSGPQDMDAEVALCQELLELLQRHNPKEEAILYPQVDDVLPAASVARVRLLLSSGHLPDGWTCAQAPA